MPGVSHAAQRDGRDTRGALDIASVAHSHANGSVTHVLTTYRPFSGRLLKGGNSVAFGFDTSGDHRPDRLLIAIWYQGRLRGVILNARGKILGVTRVMRPNQRAIAFTAREDFFGQSGRYEWLALTTFKGKRVCRKTCTDVAPNRGLISHVLWQLETLSVTLTGSGRVKSVPAGVDCTTTCSARLREGTILRFEATAAEGWIFTGWGGACAGMENCTVTLDEATSVTATFVPQYALSISVAGPGEVTVNPPNTMCFGIGPCVHKYVSGTTVTLTAEVGMNYVFDGWTGDCAGTNPVCTLTMDRNRSVVAHTRYKSTTLQVVVDGSSGAGGRVTSSPAGIDCPGDCSETWPGDVTPTLTATPDPGSVFVEWAPGTCHSMGPVCIVSLYPYGETRTATATFALAR